MAEVSGSAGTEPTRVFVLDDHEVVRCGLHELIAGPEARCRGSRRPLPDGDGITVCRELRSRMPDLSCLILTSFDDEDALLDSIMAGAAGYVLKEVTGTGLVTAVRTVATGQSMLDPATTARLMCSLRAPGTPGKQISKKMYLSEKTVKNHISRLLAKLGVARRVQAAVIATQVHDHERDQR